MPGTTLSVLLVTRDNDVKLVSASLQNEGITSRSFSTLRDLQRESLEAMGSSLDLQNS